MLWTRHFLYYTPTWYITELTPSDHKGFKGLKNYLTKKGFKYCGQCVELKTSHTGIYCKFYLVYQYSVNGISGNYLCRSFRPKTLKWQLNLFIPLMKPHNKCSIFLKSAEPFGDSCTNPWFLDVLKGFCA